MRSRMSLTMAQPPRPSPRSQNGATIDMLHLSPARRRAWPRWRARKAATPNPSMIAVVTGNAMTSAAPSPNHHGKTMPMSLTAHVLAQLAGDQRQQQVRGVAPVMKNRLRRHLPAAARGLIFAGVQVAVEARE